MLITVSVGRFYALFCTYFVRMIHFTLIVSKGVENVICHDMISNEINTYNMSGNVKVKRICEWCRKKFIANITVTRFCSKRCL